MSWRRVKSAVQQALQHARPSSTGWWRTNCPECLARTGKEDRKQCLAINVRSGVFKCWKCQLTGKLEGGTLPDQQDEASEPEKEMEKPEGFVYLGSHEGMTSVSLEPARQYALKRCPEELWLETGIGACVSGRYAGRVVVPVLAEDGATWLGWVGRTWYPSDKAYTYPEGMNRGDALYNGGVLHRDDRGPVMVVEGVFDAIHLWPDAVALLGKASEEQMEALELSRRPVVIVLDGDAWTEAYSMAARLKLRGQRAGWVRLPPTLDPDEVDRAWLDEEVRRAFAQ